MMETPVTQGQYLAVMGKNPSYFKEAGLDAPVEQVSWHDVHDFLRRLNGRISDLHLALPSEAQWEYACRAGTETAIYTGDLKILNRGSAPTLDPIAWYYGNSGINFDLPETRDISRWGNKRYPSRRAGT